MANYIATDTDLEAVADAIRTKGGTSGQLVFPAGFVDAIDAIPSGGGGDPYEKARALMENSATEYIDDTITTLQRNGFAGCTNLVTVICHNVEYIRNFVTSGYGPFFNTGVKAVAFPKLKTTYNYRTFESSSNLEILDLGDSYTAIPAAGLFGCGKLTTLILRSPTIVSLGSTNVFNGTPLRSGGTGGTIYIPKTLYDALGTGQNDYQAASNWSTVHGYGTITWAKIEGSIYETQYGDGTTIQT